MRRLVLGVATIGLVASGSAHAAVPTPRPGCFAVRDATGDGNLLAQLEPALGATSDPAVDIVGLNLGVTPRSVTVYLSLKKLADPLTPGGTLPASYEVNLQGVGGKSVAMWMQNYGPAQPARDAVKDVGVRDPEEPQYNFRYVRASQGAAVAPQGVGTGTAISVTVTKDLAHSFIAWTFGRASLQRATGSRFDRGRLVTLGRASTSYNFFDLHGLPSDEVASGLVKVGASRCV